MLEFEGKELDLYKIHPYLSIIHKDDNLTFFFLCMY